MVYLILFNFLQHQWVYLLVNLNQKWATLFTEQLSLELNLQLLRTETKLGVSDSLFQSFSLFKFLYMFSF